MTFDASRLTGTGPLQQIQAKPQEFDSLEQALEVAAADAGDELVVAYTNEAGETRYAVLDIESGPTQRSQFDPNGLDFGQAGITSAILVDEQIRNPSRTRTERFNDIRVVYQDEDLPRLTQSTLDLARAATSRVQVGRGEDYLRGFRMERANTAWGQQVADNRGHVLQTVASTLDRLDAELGNLDVRIAEARDAGDNDLLSVLEQEQTRLVSQRQELCTHQEILRAELLTDPRNTAVEIPGLTTRDGRPVTVGHCRGTTAKFRAVIDSLVTRRAELMAAQGEPPDPAISRQIAALDGAIGALANKQSQVVQAAGNSHRRMMALTRMGERLETSLNRLQDLRASINELMQQPSLSPTDRTRLERLRTDLRRELEQLVGTRNGSGSWTGGALPDLIRAYQQAGAASSAIELLRSQVDELRTLAENPSEHLDKTIENLNGLQATLLRTLEGMARVYDGISPAEYRQLVNVDNRVDGFRELHRSNQQSLDRLFEELQRAERLMDGGNYRGPTQSQINHLRDAQRWEPGSTSVDPFRTNQQIVGYYLDMARRRQDEIGVPVPSWAAFAAHACNGAGQQISYLMEARSAFATLASIDLSSADDREAARTLVRLWDNPQMREQMTRLLGDRNAQTMGRVMNDLRGILADPEASFTSIASALAPLSSFGGEFLTTLDTMLPAFIQGNTDIATNILQADLIYEEARASGKTPRQAVDALREAVRSGRVHDPNGLLVRAYSSHARAVETARQMRLQGASPEEIQQSVAVMELFSSFGLGWQEQSTFLQTDTTFGQSDVSDALSRTSEGMYLDLPNGQRFHMVGNWQDLATRMGAQLRTGPQAAQAFADSLTDEEWRDAKRINPNLPHRTPGAQPSTDAYWVQLRVQPNQVIHDEHGNRIRPGTVVFFESRVPPPPGTAAAMFYRGSITDAAMQQAVLEAPTPATAPQFHHDGGGVEVPQFLVRAGMAVTATVSDIL